MTGEHCGLARIPVMNDTKNLLIVGLVALAAFLIGSADREGAAVAQGYPGGTSDSNSHMVAVTGTTIPRLVATIGAASVTVDPVTSTVAPVIVKLIESRPWIRTEI